MATNDDGPPLPPGVKRQWKTLADGTRKAYHYHRATGAPFHGEPESLLFKTEYREAERATERPAAPDRERFTALLEEFLGSPDHKRRSAATRHNHRKYIDLIRERFAHLYVDDLNLREIKAEFYEWRDEMADTPATADLAVGMLRRVLNWAEERGKIEFNRAAKVKRLVEDGQNRSEITWAPEERQALLDAASDGLRKAILLDRF